MKTINFKIIEILVPIFCCKGFGYLVAAFMSYQYSYYACQSWRIISLFNYFIFVTYFILWCFKYAYLKNKYVEDEHNVLITIKGFVL